jgi:hypothetical protein
MGFEAAFFNSKNKWVKNDMAEDENLVDFCWGLRGVSLSVPSLEVFTQANVP